MRTMQAPSKRRNPVSRAVTAGAFAIVLLLGCSAHPPGATTNAWPMVGSAAAAPPLRVPPAPGCGIRALRENLLREVNAARARGMTCGSRRMPPTAPLDWNDSLSSAASRHSADMARRDYFDHANPEGQRVGERVTAEGYRWRSVGENIAGGDRSVEIVMRGWMDSPGHCTNIMNPEFRDVGAACMERQGTTWGTYWTMVLGRRR